MTEKIMAWISLKPQNDRGYFQVTVKEYTSLTLEEQKELDRNFWRFPFKGGYEFEEMDEEAKAFFRNQDMIINHSILAEM